MSSGLAPIIQQENQLLGYMTCESFVSTRNVVCLFFFVFKLYLHAFYWTAFPVLGHH